MDDLTLLPGKELALPVFFAIMNGGSPMFNDINLNLLSGGFFHCNAAWTRPANALDRCYKVYFPVSGTARLEMDTGTVPIKARRLYFISGYRLQRQVCEGLMDIYWLHFVPESLYLRYLLDQLPSVQSWPLSSGSWPARSFGHICRIFENPDREQNQPRQDISAEVVCRISGFLLNLVAHCLEKLEDPSARDVHSDFYRLKPALDYMQQHSREQLSLRRIAAAVGLAPNYFHRRFHELFGTTPLDFIVSQRLNQARHLLASTSLTIKEVANTVGYNDPLYFTRVFSCRFGMPPRKYRAIYHLNNVNPRPRTPNAS